MTFPAQVSYKTMNKPFVALFLSSSASGSRHLQRANRWRPYSLRPCSCPEQGLPPVVELRRHGEVMLVLVSFGQACHLPQPLPSCGTQYCPHGLVLVGLCLQQQVCHLPLPMPGGNAQRRLSITHWLVRIGAGLQQEARKVQLLEISRNDQRIVVGSLSPS